MNLKHWYLFKKIDVSISCGNPSNSGYAKELKTMECWLYQPEIQVTPGLETVIDLCKGKVPWGTITNIVSQPFSENLASSVLKTVNAQLLLLCGSSRIPLVITTMISILNVLIANLSLLVTNIKVVLRLLM